MKKLAIILLLAMSSCGKEQDVTEASTEPRILYFEVQEQEEQNENADWTGTVRLLNNQHR